jgi:hypothetical protein
MQCLEQADVWDDRSDNLSPHNHNARTQLRYMVAYARGGRGAALVRRRRYGSRTRRASVALRCRRAAGR